MATWQGFLEMIKMHLQKKNGWRNRRTRSIPDVSNHHSDNCHATSASELANITVSSSSGYPSKRAKLFNS